MTRRREMRLRYFEQQEGQRHIGEDDHYLYAQPEATTRLAIIGCGTIGQEHAKVATLLGRARVHGLFDEQERSSTVALERLASMGQSDVRVYDSLDQGVSDAGVDAYIIATPNYTHLQVLKAVMASGKPVLIEKPMVTTLEDAVELMTLCNDYPAPVRVGLQYRFKSIYTEAAHEIHTRQSIGDVKTLQMFEHRPPFLDKVKQWNKFSACSGGTLIEKCCHYFDLLNRYAGAEPVSVFARGSQAVNFTAFTYNDQPSDIMDNASVIIEYANGVRANFELNMFAPNFHEELIAFGTKGRLTARETFNVFQTQQSSSRVTVELAESGAARNIDVAYPAFIESSGHHGATYFEHAAFLDALEGKPNSAATIAQGFWSILVGAAAEQSARTGQAVAIQHLLEQHNMTHLNFKDTQ